MSLEAEAVEGRGPAEDGGGGGSEGSGPAEGGGGGGSEGSGSVGGAWVNIPSIMAIDPVLGLGVVGGIMLDDAGGLGLARRVGSRVPFLGPPLTDGGGEG